MRKLNSILYSLDKTRATMGVFEMDYFCPKVFDVTLKREKSEEEKGVVALFDGKGFSPEFIQVIFRFGECVTYGITPIMAYYVN